MKLSFFFISVVILSTLVSANGAIISLPDKNGGLYDYQYDLNLQKGWNLIAHGENFPYYMAPGYIQEDLPIYQKIMNYVNIPAVERKKADSPLFTYVYDSTNNQYTEIFPDNPQGIGITKTNDAMWVYIKEPTRVKYFAPNIPQLVYAKLTQGWNFIAINPEMEHRTFNKIKGTCDWTAVYSYGSENNHPSKWINLLDNPNFIDKEEITENMIGLGVVIKVNNDCHLGGFPGTDDTPPILPEVGSNSAQCTDTDGGNNSLVQGTLTIQVNGKSYSESESCAYDNSPEPSSFSFVRNVSCSGKDCYVQELACMFNDVDPGEYSADIPCPHGCHNGACTS